MQALAWLVAMAVAMGPLRGALASVPVDNRTLPPFDLFGYTIITTGPQSQRNFALSCFMVDVTHRLEVGAGGDGEYNIVFTLPQSDGSNPVLPKEVYFPLYINYYGDTGYINDFFLSAALMTGDFATFQPSAQVTGATHALLVLNAWMRVVHSIETVLLATSCQMAVFDEAWVIYTGGNCTSPNAEAGAVTQYQVLYGLANELCPSFGTCLPNGIAKVNLNLINLFNTAQQFGVLGFCDFNDRRAIVAQLTVPLIQGLYLSVYSLRSMITTPYDYSDQGPAFYDLWAKAYFYSIALLPQIAQCNLGIALGLQATMNVTNPSPFSDGIDELQIALQSIYPCLGVACADVGGIPGLQPCVQDIVTRIAGYTPVYATPSVLSMDLDLVEMTNGSTVPVDYNRALNVYTNGRGFNGLDPATGALLTWQFYAQVTPQLWDLAGQQAAQYWFAYTATTRADDFLMSALQQPAANGAPYLDASLFASASDAARATAIGMGVLALVNLPQIKRYLDTAVGECVGGGMLAQAGLDWDSAFALYAGSSVGPTGNATGWLWFSFTKQKSLEFGTFDAASQQASAHVYLLLAFAAGQAAIASGDCVVAGTYASIVYSWTRVPLLQGLISALLRSTSTAVGSPQRMEAWALAIALLPSLQQCSSSAASSLRSNLDPVNAMASIDAMTLIRQLQSNYACLQVSCGNVGATASNEGCSDSYVAATAAPVLSQAAIAGVSIGVAILYVFSTWVCYVLGRASGYKHAQLEQHGMDGAGTSAARAEMSDLAPMVQRSDKRSTEREDMSEVEIV